MVVSNKIILALLFHSTLPLVVTMTIVTIRHDKSEVVIVVMLLVTYMCQS